MKIDRVIETVRRHKLNEMMTMGAGAIGWLPLKQEMILL